MPTATIEDLTGQMKHALTEARAIAKKAEDEDRDFTPEEAGQLREHMAKATEAKAAIEKAKGNDELRKTLADLGDDIALNAKTDDDGRRRTASGFDLPDRRKSIGQQFTDSPSTRRCSRRRRPASSGRSSASSRAWPASRAW